MWVSKTPRTSAIPAPMDSRPVRLVERGLEGGAELGWYGPLARPVRGHHHVDGAAGRAFLLAHAYAERQREARRADPSCGHVDHHLLAEADRLAPVRLGVHQLDVEAVGVHRRVRVARLGEELGHGVVEPAEV